MKKSSHPSVFFTLLRLLKYIYQNNKFKVFLMLFSIILGVVVELYFASFMGILIDAYITPSIINKNPEIAGLTSFLIFSACILAFGVLSAFFVTRLGALISQKTMFDLRRELFSYMQGLSISYFDTHDAGMIMGLYTNDLDTLEDVVSQSIPQSFAMLINVITMFVAMIFKSWQLTIFVVVYIVIVILLTRAISKKSAFYFRQIQSQLGAFTGFVEESIYSSKVVKVFSHEQKSVQDFDVYAESMRKSADKANRYANTYMPLLMNVGNLLYVVIVGVGILFVVSNTAALTIGGLATFLQLVKAFTGPFAQISQHLNSIIRGTAGANRIWTFLDTPYEKDGGDIELIYSDKLGKYFWKSSTQTPSTIPLEGNVEFKDVSFSYDGRNKVLHNITLSVKSGEKIAFVGSTGAGKTTITNLLNRFYEIDTGVIEIDGIDIRRIKKSALRRSMAVVLQDMHLFSGTIRENIRYGKLDASDEDVERSAKIAHADEFILSLKDGYDTQISGTDCQLSEGQKQLLTIARASIANQAILVMDEATSSVDSASEACVQKAIDALMKGKTVFMIAHRLSTIKNADKIVVLEHGSIVEMGNHETLLAKKGRYYELYTGQAELD